MQYRINKAMLFSTLATWNEVMDFSVSLIACGGTALTLLDWKDSTKDIDLVLPKKQEYVRFTSFLHDTGYEHRTMTKWVHPRQPEFIFDLFSDNQVYVTDLLDSPLEPGMHTEIHKLKRIYLGVLNYYDLIITKMARGSGVDVEDCMAVLTNTQIDLERLINRYKKTASYSPFAPQMKIKLSYLMDKMRDSGFDIREMEESYEQWRP